MIDMTRVSTIIELPHIYDGWSIAVMKNGELINRWEETDYRYRPTQDWLEAALDEEANPDI